MSDRVISIIILFSDGFYKISAILEKFSQTESSFSASSNLYHLFYSLFVLNQL